MIKATQLTGAVAMTQNSTPSTGNPTWFTRSGAAIDAERVFSIDIKKGTARYSYTPTCKRCGGLGGSEGWRHTGWTCYLCGGCGKGEPRTEPVYTEDRLAKLIAAHEKRRTSAKAKAEAAEAERRAAEQALWKTWCAEQSEVIAEMRAHAGGSEFLADLMSRIDAVRILTERQIDAARSVIEKARSRAEARERELHSEWIGEIGQRCEFTITVKRIIDLSKPEAFPPIWKYLHICEDACGNRIIYIGAGSAVPREGKSATVKATVKEHTIRNDVRQTVIARPTPVRANP